MAAREIISKYVEAHLRANWLATPIQFENIEPKDPNNVGKLLSEGVDPYLFSALRYGESTAAEVGNTLKRTQGFLYFEVRVKDGSGTRLAQTYLSDLQSMLEYNNIGDVKIRGSISRDGFSSGGWYILPISFKFRYDRQE